MKADIKQLSPKKNEKFWWKLKEYKPYPYSMGRIRPPPHVLGLTNMGYVNLWSMGCVLWYESNFCFAPPSILQWVCPQEEVERSLSLYSQCNPSLIKVHKVSLLCLTKESSIKLRIKTCQPGKAAWKERVSLMLQKLFRLNNSISVPKTLICTRWTCWFLIYIDSAPTA